MQILEKQIERDLDPDSGMTAAEVWEHTAATTINIVNESLQVWGPDFVMFLVCRVLPARIRREIRPSGAREEEHI
jgi:hypothetical protein